MGLVERVQRDLEELHAGDSGDFPTVVERAQAEAPYVAARFWLRERWGDGFACPVCENTEWQVSEIGLADRPAGFFSFSISCAYCGNTMQVVPGQVYLDSPVKSQQLQLPETEEQR